MSNYFKAFSFLKKGIGGTTKSDQIKKSNKIHRYLKMFKLSKITIFLALYK